MMDFYTIDDWLDDSDMTAERLDGQDIEDVYCWEYAIDATNAGKLPRSVVEWAGDVEERFRTLEQHRVELDNADGSFHTHVVLWCIKDADA